MPHPWPVFTPEDNHATLSRLGTGPATTLAYQAALTAEMAHLESITAVSAATGAGTYATAWSGVGAAASAVSQTGLNTAGMALTAWLAEKLPLIATVVSGWQTAATAMVPAEEALANRVEEATDEAINPLVWGALTPRIVDLNLEYYGHMWPRNAAAGAAYGTVARASAAAMLAVPPPPALTGGSPAAPAAAAATIAEDGGSGAAGAAMRVSAQAAGAAIRPAAAVPQSLREAVPVPAAEGVLRPLTALGAPSPAMTTSTPVGMFARVSAPAVAAPVVEAPVVTEAGPLTAAPRAGAAPAGMAYPGAGLTSYLRPADGFTSVPSAGGRPAGATPGMLNAAALRGPLATAGPAMLAPAPTTPHGSSPRRRELKQVTSSTAPQPKCKPEKVIEMQGRVDDYGRRFEAYARRAEEHDKPVGYDGDDPALRQAFADHQREAEALRDQGRALVAEQREIQRELAECGLRLGNEGALEWVPAMPYR